MRLDKIGARRVARALLLLGAVAAGGCATIADPLRANLGAGDGKVAACAEWYRRLDAGIDATGVRDGGAWRLPGFPYLRTDRHLASLRETALAGDAAFDAWTGRMAALDLDARSVELRNLPEPALLRLQSDRDEALNRTRGCSATLAAHDFAAPDKRAALAGRARVPDDYATWERALGLYAITRLPFSSGIDKWHREAVEAFRKSSEGTLEIGTTARFGPPGPPDLQQAREIVSAAPRDALGLPEFTAAQRDVLFDAFAPVIEVETTGPFDRIGAPAWGDGRAPVVDATRPLYYRKLAFTRNGEETLVQLVYVAWFSERPKKNAFDMLGGSLDGIVWRVTLDRKGEPLVYDTIHPCGCFHMFFPADGVEPVPPPARLIEWAFVPAGAPALPEGGRMKILLQSRTHYMVGLGVVRGAGDGVEPVGFDDYDDLRSMPVAGGGSRSMFASDGLVPGTDRGERALFWPMGVPSAGAMRQWGRHSTAFLGRRHFDDADLMERRFSLPRN
jgi:hypothetical protein